MAKKTRSELKTFFQNESTPDSTEFGHLIDSQLILNDGNTQHIEGVITASGVFADEVSLNSSLTIKPTPPTFTSSNAFGIPENEGIDTHTFFGPIYQSSSGADSASYFLIPANFGTTESPIKESGIFIKKTLELEGIGENQLSQSISASLLISGSGGHLAFDSKGINQWGDNFYIKTYAPYVEARGRILFHSSDFHDRSSSMEIQTLRIQDRHSDPDISKVGNVNIGKELLMNNVSLLNLTNNNTTRGPFNPIVAAIRNSGKCLNPDIDFKEGFNNVKKYDNRSGLGGHVTLERTLWAHESASAFNPTWGKQSVSYPNNNTTTIYYKGWTDTEITDHVSSEIQNKNVSISIDTSSLGVPNSSGYVLKIHYDGKGNSSTVQPNLGGFRQFYPNPQSNDSLNQMNHTYVQVFKALLPDTHEFIPNQNSQGNNDTTYWLTNNKGTGKWEWYARINHVGDTPIINNDGTIKHINTAGHVSIRNITDTEEIQYNNTVTCYLASCTVYDMTEADTSLQRKIGLNKINPSHPLDIYLNDIIGSINTANTSANINLNGAPVRIQNHTSSLYLDGNTLYFSGSDSYINVSTDNNLDFSVNNSTKIKLTSDADSYGDIQFNYIENNKGLNIESRVGNDYSTIRLDSEKTHFFSNGENRLTIENNVGIGTSTPQSTLNVVDDNPILTIRDTETTAIDANPILNLKRKFTNVDSNGNPITVNHNWNIEVTSSNLTINFNREDNPTSYITPLTIEETGSIVMGDPSFGDDTIALRVSGSVTASAIKSSGTAVFDKIFFEDDEKLLMGEDVSNHNFEIYHSSSGDSIIKAIKSQPSHLKIQYDGTGSLHFSGSSGHYLSISESKIIPHSPIYMPDDKGIGIIRDNHIYFNPDYLGDHHTHIYHSSSNDSFIKFGGDEDGIISSSNNIIFRNYNSGNPINYYTADSSSQANVLGSGSIYVDDTSVPFIDDDDTVNNIVLTSNSDTFYKAPTLNVVPIGAIAMWGGSVGDIPNGWYLCNGENGTFNFTEGFVKSGNALDRYLRGKSNPHIEKENMPHFPITSSEASLTGNIGPISKTFVTPHENVNLDSWSPWFGPSSGPIDFDSNPHGYHRMWKQNDYRHADNTVPKNHKEDYDDGGELNYNMDHDHASPGVGEWNKSIRETINVEPPYYVLAYIQYKGE
jgi:hypothetical protein